MKKRNFEDIVFSIDSKGNVKVEDWPDYAMDQAELIRKLRSLANNLEKIKDTKT